jgi:hypothetical protein
MKRVMRFLMWLDIKRLQIKSGGFTYREMQLDIARLIADNNELRARLRLFNGAVNLENEINRIADLLNDHEPRIFNEGRPEIKTDVINLGWLHIGVAVENINIGAMLEMEPSTSRIRMMRY